MGKALRRSLLVWLAVLGCGDDRIHVEPEQAPLAGGVELRIVGRGFRDHGGVIVLVGEQPARAVVIADERTIRARLPPGHEPGPVDVTLLFADGTSRTLEAALRFEVGAVDIR